MTSKAAHRETRGTARHTAIGDPVQRGFTYLSLLFFVVVLGIGLSAVAVSWTTERQREKERELLDIGAEFRNAIALYYNRSPGVIKEFPRDLTDLLKDARYPGVQRYLRRVYRDPMTGQAQWGIVAAPEGGIMGIYSLSTDKPLKSENFGQQDADFSVAATYSDWKFIYQPAGDAAAPPATAEFNTN